MAILCCVCGTSIEPNAMNMCASCVAREVDIAEGIALQGELIQCSGCLRFQARNTAQSLKAAWLDCAWESAELMALCLKHVHGLSKARLLDAQFVWTEPHSKRIQVKLTLEREVLNHATVQNACVVTFTVKTIQCPDCIQHFGDTTWRALVQLRQKAEHKRTFLRLEQVLLQRHAHRDAISIASVKDGVDFFFAGKNAAERFIHFVNGHVPMRSKQAQKLVSENVRQGTANLQTTYCVELCPICKDDLLVLPPKVAQNCSSIGRIALCAKTTSWIHLVDPRTGRRAELMADRYWKTPFVPLLASPHMTDFVVLDVEPVEAPERHGAETETTGKKKGKRPDVLADVEVARVSDFGVNDTTFQVRTHLGAILEAGDTVRGYDLASAVLGSRYAYSLKDGELPDVVLVRKVVPHKEHRPLKRLMKNSSGKMTKTERAREEQELEAFAEEFDVDEEEEEEEEANEAIDALQAITLESETEAQEDQKVASASAEASIDENAST